MPIKHKSLCQLQAEKFISHKMPQTCDCAVQLGTAVFTVKAGRSHVDLTSLAEPNVE